MRRLLRKLRWVLLIAAILAVVFFGYYGTRVVYHARVFIELRNGDGVISGARIAPGSYMISGGCYSQYARDASGRTYLVVRRGRENGVLVFGSDGVFQREIRLKRLESAPESPEQLAVSPSGRRLWTVNTTFGHKFVSGIAVYCYSAEGRELQRWPAGKGSTQFFSAIGENGAYLWSGEENVFAYALGRGRPLESPVISGQMWFAPDGWIWDMEKPDGTGRYSSNVWQIWKRKPGAVPVLVGTITDSAMGLPFHIDRTNNLYIWRYGRGRVYKVSPDRQAQFVLDAESLIRTRRSGKEDLFRVLSADDDGSIYFETATNRILTDAFTYRIYKAELMLRWRGWLLDLAWRP